MSATTSTEHSGTPSDDDVARMSTEIAQLRQTLAATEAELLALRERRSLEMARLERQVYWLERWGIDLDAWMRRRPVRLAARSVGALLRLLRRIAGRP